MYNASPLVDESNTELPVDLAQAGSTKMELDRAA
jgi:hypothetical protein